MKKNDIEYYCKISVDGINLNNLINSCVNAGIDLKNIVKVEPKKIEFSLSDGDLKKFKNINTQGLEIKILRQSMLRRFLHFLLYRIGLIVGLVVSFALILFMQNRLFSIQILGLNNISQTEVEKVLKDYGINKFSLMNFDKIDLENYLAKSLNFSFVSVVTEGNVLIISVKEELPDLDKFYEPITSSYNMIIKDICVYSGTTNKKSGDIVFKGETLVEPYQVINGEKIDIVPCAEISCEVILSDKYEFFATETKTVMTGKSKVISTNYMLGKIKLFGKTYKNNFGTFEIKEYSKEISNYFLPIRMTKTIAYETKTVEIENNFEKSKEKIINDLKQKVYSKVTSEMNVESEDIQINSTNYGNIVTIYLKSSVYLKYGK